MKLIDLRPKRVGADLRGVCQLGSNVNQKALIERNADEVEIAGWLPVLTTGTNFPANSAGRIFINVNNLSKVRQNELLKKITFYPNLAQKLCTQYWFQVWRKISSTYTLIYEEDILSKITETQINTIELAQQVQVNEGDVFGFAVDNNGSAGILWKMTTVVTTGSLYYQSTEKQTTGFDWESQNAFTYVVPLNGLGKAPLMVVIGDSIPGGAQSHTPFNQDTKEDNHTVTFAHQMSLIDSNYVYQNTSKGSQKSAWVLAAMADSVIKFKPKMVIVHVGVNDIAAGTVTKEVYLSNMTSILDLCAANGIIPVINKILPWTGGDNTEMATRDEWMIDLKVLVDTYSGSVWVDFDAAMGQFRAGGAEGNLWDFIPAYDSGDHVHPSAAGYVKMAEVIDIEIKKKYRFT